MPKMTKHANASRLDFRGLRIFILINHVLVEAVVHQFVNLGLDPGLTKRSEILPGIAVEK
jgi:hypothetical protein